MSVMNSYLRDMHRFGPLLTPGEEIDLGQRIQAGDESAREELIAKNLRFVMAIARRYCSQNSALTLSDLISVGNMGLITASHKFNWKLKYRFVTYAFYWIRQAILREIARSSRLARVPISSFCLYHNYMQTSSKMEQRLGYLPSAEQVASKMGMSMDRLSIVHEMQVEKIPEEFIQEEVQETNLRDVLLQDALKTLPEKERDIICYYYGLNNHELLESYKRIGDIVGLSHEAVRLNIQRGLTKIEKYLRRRSIVYENFKELLPWDLQ
jgi:RNA polymerase primary sigma factor